MRRRPSNGEPTARSPARTCAAACTAAGLHAAASRAHSSSNGGAGARVGQLLCRPAARSRRWVQPRACQHVTKRGRSGGHAQGARGRTWRRPAAQRPRCRGAGTHRQRERPAGGLRRGTCAHHAHTAAAHAGGGGTAQVQSATGAATGRTRAPRAPSRCAQAAAAPRRRALPRLTHACDGRAAPCARAGRTIPTGAQPQQTMPARRARIARPPRRAPPHRGTVAPRGRGCPYAAPRVSDVRPRAARTRCSTLCRPVRGTALPFFTFWVIGWLGLVGLVTSKA
jgi:hypothetical protein